MILRCFEIEILHRSTFAYFP